MSTSTDSPRVCLDPEAVARLLPAVLEASGEAAALVRRHSTRPRSVRLKGRIDLVTETDLAVEELLKKRLSALLPGAGVLAEESAGSDEPSGCCWIVDPVDGTTNFAHGLPLVAVSLALWHAGEPVLGVVETPLLGERFHAVRGKGAFCNNEPIRVGGAARLEEALVATGFPYDIREKLPEVLARLKNVLPAVRGVRRCGAAALDLAWTACGRFDAFYEAGLRPWDMAAGMLLVTEAGGRVSGLDGKPTVLTSGEMLASNGRVHDALAALLA